MSKQNFDFSECFVVVTEFDFGGSMALEMIFTSRDLAQIVCDKENEEDQHMNAKCKTVVKTLNDWLWDQRTEAENKGMRIGSSFGDGAY